MSEDRFVRTIVAEIGKDITAIDVEFLAKSYCQKWEDQIEILIMIDELEKLSNGVNQIMEFATPLCEDIICGLFIL